MLEIDERVNHLDELMAQLIQTIDRTSKEMQRSYERSQRDNNSQLLTLAFMECCNKMSSLHATCP